MALSRSGVALLVGLVAVAPAASETNETPGIVDQTETEPDVRYGPSPAYPFGRPHPDAVDSAS